MTVEYSTLVQMYCIILELHYGRRTTSHPGSLSYSVIYSSTQVKLLIKVDLIVVSA